MVNLETNNDFLNQGTSKKKRTPQEIEMDNFPEYYALNNVTLSMLLTTGGL